MTKAEWSRMVDVTQLQPEGRSFDLSADQVTRAAIANRIKTPGIDLLSATVTVSPRPDGATVRGSLKARLHRICVASLEPMLEDVDEAFDVIFSRNIDDDDASAAPRPMGDPGPSQDIVLSEQDEEALIGDEIDVADLVIQQLALAMSPYPRRDGAAGLVNNFGKAAESSPFDVLKSLATDKPDNSE